jgi:hypothetical protein
MIVELENETVMHKMNLFVPMASFGYADKPTEKHRLLICCERKILFRLKKTS